MARVNACWCLSIIMMMMISASLPHHVQGSITCGMVLTSLSSCLGYLRGGGTVPPSCCDGLKSANDAANTTPDLRAACQCIKTIVPQIGAKPNFVNSLAGICHVDIPYKYTASFDCSKLIRR